MEIKNLIRRLFKPRYVVLNKKGVSHLLDTMNFYKENGYAFSLSSFKQMGVKK